MEQNIFKTDYYYYECLLINLIIKIIICLNFSVSL